MFEFKNIVIPADIRYHIMPYMTHNIDVFTCIKDEFLLEYDKAVEFIKDNITVEHTYNSARYIILSYIHDNSQFIINKRVSDMSNDEFLKTFIDACSKLRSKIMSIDEYYDIL